MITVDENLPTPDKVKPKWWLEHLRLCCEDKERLLRGMELTDSIMNAAQILMQGQFQDCFGFQDTTMGPLLSFLRIESDKLRNGSAIQILHTGM